MNKNIYVLMTSLMIYSCAIHSREVESQYSESDLPTETETSLLNDFNSDQLDEKSIHAFEERAVEKVSEFFEYLSIIQDTTLDATLRKKALEQCQELFYPKISYVALNNQKYSIKDFLDGLYLHEIYTPSISDIILSRNYHRQSGENSYSGEVKMRYENNGEEGKAVIILIKTSKSFGEEVRQVWEVYVREALL